MSPADPLPGVLTPGSPESRSGARPRASKRHPSAGGPSGWVALCGKIIMDGTRDGSRSTVTYAWDGVYHPAKALAVGAGWRLADGTDDFNIGWVERGRLVWFGWGDEQHPVEDYPAVAAQFGWTT